jgi:hypothetical protein
MATMVRDVTVANISIGGGSWTKYSVERFYGGTAMAPSFASNASGDTGQYGSLAMTFQGVLLCERLHASECLLSILSRDIGGFHWEHPECLVITMGICLYRRRITIQRIVHGCCTPERQTVVPVTDSF